MVLDKVKEILSTQFDVDADSITPDTDIVDDLGADSLDLVDMLMSLEDEFNIGVCKKDGGRVICPRFF